MRFFHLIVALLLALSVTAAPSCVSNPTPHPGSEDPTRGGGSTGDMTGGGMGTSSGTQDNGATADATAGPEPSESSDAAGPSDVLTCEAIEEDFEAALGAHQGCADDADCVLLVDENDCDCTRAIAVAASGVDQAQALLDQALACGSTMDDVAGSCIADAAPIGNEAQCLEGLCAALTPDESCLGFEDAETTGDGESSTDDDAGPDAAAGCEGSPPSCISCDSDVELDAVCVDDEWTCEEGELDPTCDEQTCELFDGELCCDEDGASESALCPSPSQAYCADGSPAVMACGTCGDGACDPSESAEGCPEECAP